MPEHAAWRARMSVMTTRRPGPAAPHSGASSAVALRPAVASEAALLSRLALRSKGHWGYDTAFLEACRAELTLSSEQARGAVVAVVTGVVVGFHLLVTDPPLPDGTAELGLLFVDPDHIGLGVGSLLLADARRTAAARGWSTLRLESDPGAEAFYRHHGARRVGEVASGSIPVRVLPLLELPCR